MGKFDLIYKVDRELINLGCILLKIKRFPFYFLENKSRAKNQELKKIAKNKKCYICGMGPSFQNVDLSEIDGDSIVVNHFYKLNHNENFRPTFYCLIDEGFYTEEYNNRVVDIIKKYTQTVFLLNGKYKRLFEKQNGVFPNVYYTYIWGGFFNRKNKIDYTKLSYITSNVICEAIMLAIYAEYKEIILLGCDFNSFASLKPIHCYEEDDKRKIPLRDELFRYSFIVDSHYEIAAYAKKRGISILNATPGSLIDAYERIELKELNSR